MTRRRRCCRRRPRDPHPDHAFLVADAVALLQGGALVGPGPPAALVTAERLRETYGVETVIGTLETPAGPRRVCAPLVGAALP